jgi:hypothetical protein
MGAVVSTLIMSPWLDAAALDAATLDCLARSKYERAYLHCVLDVERALKRPGLKRRTVQVRSLPLVVGSDSLPSQALFSPNRVRPKSCARRVAVPHAAARARARSGAHHRVSQTEGAKGDECTHAQREAKSRTSTAATE